MNSRHSNREWNAFRKKRDTKRENPPASVRNTLKGRGALPFMEAR
jgi:hypothetical protein